jgi:hypothetical protein
MDIKAREILIKIISIAIILCIPMASANAVTKPKAAGRTAASIPNTVLSGLKAPSNSIGIDGDFYIDIKNLNIYGPKMKKKWPKAVSLKGTNGSNGTDGKSGSDGKSGTDGKTITNASTVAGPIGNQGTQGIAGDTGLKGDQGLRGEVGATGAQGIVGPIGVQGPIGLTGVTGSQGPAGSGSQGAPGATGATGSQGPGGATGSQGPAGSGATGSQGPAGPSGSTGANGSAGATGSTGPEGPAGPTGLTGSQGTSGVAGATGLTGDVGQTGITGSQGIQGENGFSQVSWASISSWSLSTSSLGAGTESTSFGSLAIGKTYYINITVHGISGKVGGYFTGELIPSSAPAFFVMDQSVSEANVYNGVSSSHTYSFNLHGLITVGSAVTSFTFRVNDGGGHTGVYPMTLTGKGAFIMVGAIA